LYVRSARGSSAGGPGRCTAAGVRGRLCAGRTAPERRIRKLDTLYPPR